MLAELEGRRCDEEGRPARGLVLSPPRWAGTCAGGNRWPSLATLIPGTIRTNRNAAASAAPSRFASPTFRRRWSATKADALEGNRRRKVRFADGGCLMNIDGTLAKRRDSFRGEHLASFLWHNTEKNEGARHERPRQHLPQTTCCFDGPLPSPDAAIAAHYASLSRTAKADLARELLRRSPPGMPRCMVPRGARVEKLKEVVAAKGIASCSTRRRQRMARRLRQLVLPGEAVRQADRRLEAGTVRERRRRDHWHTRRHRRNRDDDRLA